ncbi:endo alpha-1,4 polygalactosaminidase [Glycomyces paridis]|uniref:Glycoside hydrolase n=1 Tax=Glycomyces paridis TaxID=2126555 RepID=A0A4S8PI26_9ACTN|nr:endo alpha-1,4 polygalactosaminidase [Glycomyces paridis]THV27984.1 glycoside hydrolase [Glycomyces paridis]
MRRPAAALAALPLLLAACTTGGGAPADGPDGATWLYWLTGYPAGGFDAAEAGAFDYAVVDLARDGGEDYWSAEEVGALQAEGTSVFAYFSMGSIEDYRPESEAVEDAGLVLNRWGDWPDEHFVAYWDPQWWDLVMAPRLDQAAAAGFDGVYLDVPNAYEEIDLALVPGETRESLAAKMAELVVAAAEYAGEDLMILPQNSPELREHPGYTDAIDGLGVEHLYYLDTGEACEEDWCAETLDHVRALREAGKLILAVDYTDDPGERAEACRRYREEGFAGAVAGIDLDAPYEPCP